MLYNIELYIVALYNVHQHIIIIEKLHVPFENKTPW